MSDSAALALLDELDLGSARGGRKPSSPMSVQVVGGLGQDDLEELANPGPVASPGQAIAKISHSHHQLAQLLAKGVVQEEASLITGYSPAYISRLKNEDPAFQNLMAHYGQEREAVFVDVLERMKSIGLSSLDELQARLADDPAGWSRRELMELAELLLIKPGQGRGQFASGGSGGPAVSVNVKFVTAQVPERHDRTAGSVDVQFEDLPEGTEVR